MVQQRTMFKCLFRINYLKHINRDFNQPPDNFIKLY